MHSTPVSKSLDKKLRVFGFEVMDLFVVFFGLSVLNLLFGNSLVMVWLPSIMFAITLRLSKRGKPEKFIMHWMRYQITPATYSAFEKPSHGVSLRKAIWHP